MRPPSASPGAITRSRSCGKPAPMPSSSARPTCWLNCGGWRRRLRMRPRGTPELRRMRLKIILTGIGLAILAVVALAFTVLMATDFNDYRDLVQQRMKAATGRDLVIAGDI